MKKYANTVIAALVSTAVLGLAAGYGITFWEHWQSSQQSLSSFNPPQNSTQDTTEEQERFEPAVLDAPRILLTNDS
ncbi:MAG: hypothetical protein ACK5YR_20460 [Pirellula sp.]|jgi:hypothetical protein